MGGGEHTYFFLPICTCSVRLANIRKRLHSLHGLQHQVVSTTDLRGSAGQVLVLLVPVPVSPTPQSA